MKKMCVQSLHANQPFFDLGKDETIKSIQFGNIHEYSVTSQKPSTENSYCWKKKNLKF